MPQTAMSQVNAHADASIPTVLVVEDEALVRMPIAEYLRDCGFHVLEAANANEAIGLVGSGDRVDVVFSDVRMPGGMDGFGLARWVRAHHPKLPVLLTSGYTTSLSGELTGVKLIEKPYSQSQVLNRIRALIPQ